MGDTPLLPDIERILDEESAFIARPSKAVSVRIALAAYIAAQKKIDRDLSEVFARIEATMCDTHKMCDDGPVSSREGRISERDFDALTAVFTEAPLRSLAAVRAPGDEEVANALAHLETIRSGANFAQAFSADALSALITRLTARLSSAERERDEARGKAIEEAAKLVEPKGKRPCDCDTCYCGNHGDMEEVAMWDAATHDARAIRALKGVRT